MNYLTTPTTQIYGILSIFAAILAAGGNTIVLLVLWMPNQRIKSNKILTSLAISDSLVGYILLPLFSWQLLNVDKLQDCLVDYSREYITTVFIGSSLFTLGVVSYDRYILLTKLTNYDVYMSKTKVIVLLTISWAFPAVAPLVRLFGKGPFLYCVILITVGPLFVLTFTYWKIAKAIGKNDKKIKLQKDKMRKNSIEPRENSSNYELRSTEISEGGDDPAAQHQQHKRTKTTLQKIIHTKRVKSKHLKLAKTVTVLIVGYALCLLPSSIWSITDLLNDSYNFTGPYTIQNMYVFACFGGSLNSCINPIIYIFKQPGFKTSLKKLFRVKFLT